MKRGGLAYGFGFRKCCCLLLILVCVNGRSDKEVRERFYGNLVNSSAPDNGEGSIAKMFDRVLEKEFSDNDQPEGTGHFLILL
ncbi:hypothetical protein OIU76_000167 [Salix suchowensis]|nr:hypothetical protein OIU76_000167 [Salix suchowensis]